MPILHIDNLGSVGLVKDLRPYRLPPEGWTRLRNARFRDGDLVKFLGHTEVFEPPSISPYWLLSWPQVTNYVWLYAGLDKVYTVFNTTHTDITRLAGDYTGTADDLWNGVLFGGVPVINNGVDNPQSWDGTGNLQDLPNWPSGTKCKVMRGFKQFLIALNILKGGGADYYPYMVKWSDLADPGTVPTSWDETDPATLAGENVLTDTGGFIIDGLALNDTFLIYKEDAVYSMRYSGGTYVWTFTKLFESFGAIAQRCIANFEGQHFVVSYGDILIHNGQAARSVIDSHLRKWLFNGELDSNNRDKVFVAPNYAYNEMWVCYPDTSALNGLPNKALVWNWKEGTWGQRDLPDVAHIAHGLIDVGEASPIIDTVTTIINDDTNLIDGQPYSRTELRLLAADPTNTKLYWMDNGNTFNGALVPFVAEKIGLDISGKDYKGNITIDPTTTKFIRAVYPKLFNDTTGTIAVYVGSQKSVEDTVTWSGPHWFDPSTGQIKINCRVSGKLLALRFQNEIDAPLTLYGVGLDMELLGVPAVSL